MNTEAGSEQKAQETSLDAAWYALMESNRIKRKSIIDALDRDMLKKLQALVEQHAIDAEKGGDYKGARFYGNLSKQLAADLEHRQEVDTE